MENYRDLIITLIKSHRRYSGCENIVDDIADEVLKKASSVINAVTDEQIIKNYLIKAVSSAMITVPKKFNINTRTARAPLPMPASAEAEFESITAEEPEPPVYDETSQVYSSDTEVMETLSVGSIGENITTEDDEILLSAEEPVEPVTDSGETEFNQSLVDNMINGIASDEKQNSDNLIENNINYENLEDLVAEEPCEEIIDEDSPAELTIEDLELELPTAEEEEEEEIPEEQEAEAIEEPNKPAEVWEDESEIQPDTTDEFEEQVENIGEVLPESLLDPDLAEPEPVSEEIDTLFAENTAEDIEELEAQVVNEVPEPEPEPAIESEQKAATDNISPIKFKLPDFSSFEFTTEAHSYELDVISKNLNKYIEKYSGKHVKDIFELKYVKNTPIKDIASKLDIDENEVLDILNDMISIAED